MYRPKFASELLQPFKKDFGVLTASRFGESKEAEFGKTKVHQALAIQTMNHICYRQTCTDIEQNIYEALYIRLTSFYKGKSARKIWDLLKGVGFVSLWKIPL